MNRAKPLLVALVALVAGAGLVWGSADSQPPLPLVSSPIRSPDDYRAPAVQSVAVPLSGVGADDLRAVAIVGDYGNVAMLKNDMDTAVAALQAHGVSVTKFYYGDTSFTWGDIVAAAQGAHFLLYMGHGGFGWSGSSYWGGFYFGDSDNDGDPDYASPQQIRTDLDGAPAPDSIVILSHACFSAGASSDDPPDLPQADAAERVQSYAAAFTDIGMEAYFANNYWGSAAETVELILSGNTMEAVFKGGLGYSPGGLVDLTYPEPGYDMWLDQCAYQGDWNLAFVGIPGYSFQAEVATATPSPTATSTSTSTPTPTPTSSPTPTSIPTSTATGTTPPTSTPTPTTTSTTTPTSTPTPTATNTTPPTSTFTPTATSTTPPTSTATPTATSTTPPTLTPTPTSPTDTPTPTVAPIVARRGIYLPVVLMD